MEGFPACSADLVDLRRGKARRHEIDEIVMVALLAMVGGAATGVDIALFGRSTVALLRGLLRLLDPASFEACLARYVAALAERIEGRGGGRRKDRAALLRSGRWPEAAAFGPLLIRRRLHLRYAAGARATQDRQQIKRSQRLTRAFGALDARGLHRDC